MKKVIIIIFVNLIVIPGAFSQSKNIQNAYNSYNRTDRDGLRIKMKEAKSFIDLAYIHESTSNDPKMWNYRSKIYLEIMINFPELDEDAVFKATESHIRCLDRDKKGRSIVRKWTKEDEVLIGLAQCGNNLFNSAVNDFNNKKYEIALKKYTELFKVLDLDKEKILKIEKELIYRYMSYAYRDLDDIHNQKNYLQKCIDLNSLEPDVYKTISYIYFEEGEHESSLKYLSLGLENCGSDEITLIKSEIDILLKIGRSNFEIIEKLTSAIELDDLNELLYVIRAERYMEEEMYLESEQDLIYVINEIDPASEYALRNFIELYSLQINNLLDRRKKEGSRSKKIIDKNLESFYNKILPHLIKYNEIVPSDKEKLDVLAKVYYRLGMEEKSEQVREKMRELD